MAKDKKKAIAKKLSEIAALLEDMHIEEAKQEESKASNSETDSEETQYDIEDDFAAIQQ